MLIIRLYNREFILDDLGVPNVITRALKSERIRERWQCEDLACLMLLAVKMKEGAISPEKKVTTRSRKKQGNHFSP